MKHSLSLLLGLAIVLSWACAPVAPPEEESKVNVNDVAPAFSYTLLDGTEVHSDSLQGQVILLTFFATWCPPCKKELPLIQSEIHEKITDSAFTLVVSGRGHTVEELQKFQQEKGYTFPIAADPDATLYDTFATQYIPRNYVIGKDGKIKWASAGFSESEFNQMVQIIRNELAN